MLPKAVRAWPESLTVDRYRDYFLMQQEVDSIDIICTEIQDIQAFEPDATARDLLYLDPGVSQSSSSQHVVESISQTSSDPEQSPSTLASEPIFCGK